VALRVGDDHERPAVAPIGLRVAGRARQRADRAGAVWRAVVAKLQGQGNAEAERLREAMRKAIAVLQGAVGS